MYLIKFESPIIALIYNSICNKLRCRHALKKCLILIYAIISKRLHALAYLFFLLIELILHKISFLQISEKQFDTYTCLSLYYSYATTKTTLLFTYNPPVRYTMIISIANSPYLCAFSK